MVRIWVASLHQKNQRRNYAGFCFARHLKSHSRGWIRTASARRIVRRAKSPCGAFLDARLATSTRAHQKNQRRNYAGFCFARHPKSHSRGWIRTAAATSLKMAQKQPGGLFLAARLATSTRAHQKSSSVFSTLELFVLLVREAHKCRWIRTAAAMSLKTAQKQPRWTVRFTGAAAIP